MEFLTGELGGGDHSEFDVTDQADAGRGFVFDDHPPVTTWTMLRWDTLLAMIVAFHPPNGDPIETARGLAEEVRTNLTSGEEGE